MNIQKLIKVPLSGIDIKRLLDGNVKVLLYPYLSRYSSLDELFHPYDCVVILYMQNKIVNGFYGHWCCIFRNRETNEVEFFDPLAYWIDDELNAKMDPSFRKENKLDYPLLSYLIYYTGQKYKLYYNHIKFQNKNTSTCGRHCVVRLRNKHLNLEEYEKYIYSFGPNADLTVTFMTYK